jgi:ribokinase
MNAPRIAVVGHVEHVTLGLVDTVPSPGDIVHLQHPRFLPGGGGGLAFAQLVRSDAELHLFTALGNDDCGAWVRERISNQRPGVTIHAATRAEPHPRVVVMIDPAGKRTIIVAHDPLQPRGDDPLPWSILATCDAVYFTGADPASLVHARAARRLVATARRRPIIVAACVSPEVALGSVSDPRENAPLDAYGDFAPAALLLTDGPRPMKLARKGAVTHVDAPPPIDAPKGDYGAGDSFAAAFTYFFARGASVEDAARAAGPFGAAVLRGIDPLEQQRTLPS